MPLDSSKTEPRATVQAWRHGSPAITLWLGGYGLTSTIELTPEEALRLGETLVKCATAPGPRVGSAADLGYVEAA